MLLTGRGRLVDVDRAVVAERDRTRVAIRAALVVADLRVDVRATAEEATDARRDRFPHIAPPGATGDVVELIDRDRCKLFVLHSRGRYLFSKVLPLPKFMRSVGPWPISM